MGPYDGAECEEDEYDGEEYAFCSYPDEYEGEQSNPAMMFAWRAKQAMIKACKHENRINVLLPRFKDIIYDTL